MEEHPPFPCFCLCVAQGSVSAADDTQSSDQPAQGKTELKDEPRSTSPDPKGKKSKKKKPKEKVSVDFEQQREKGSLLRAAVPSVWREPGQQSFRAQRQSLLTKLVSVGKNLLLRLTLRVCNKSGCCADEHLHCVATADGFVLQSDFCCSYHKGFVRFPPGMAY